MRTAFTIACFFVAAIAIWGCSSPDSVSDPIAAISAERPAPEFVIKDSTRIVKYPSGLQIYTVLQGPGARPEEGSIIRIHYKGMVEGGATFDDTWERKKPFESILGRSSLIPGMEEALRKLNMGSRAIVTIPPALGYPEKETPPNIPPNSTLIYHVEVLGNIH